MGLTAQPATMSPQTRTLTIPCCCLLPPAASCCWAARLMRRGAAMCGDVTSMYPAAQRHSVVCRIAGGTVLNDCHKCLARSGNRQAQAVQDAECCVCKGAHQHQSRCGAGWWRAEGGAPAAAPRR